MYFFYSTHYPSWLRSAVYFLFLRYHLCTGWDTVNTGWNIWCWFTSQLLCCSLGLLWQRRGRLSQEGGNVSSGAELAIFIMDLFLLNTHCYGYKLYATYTFIHYLQYIDYFNKLQNCHTLFTLH